MYCRNPEDLGHDAAHPNRSLLTGWLSLVLRVSLADDNRSHDMVGHLRVGELKWGYHGYEAADISEQTLLRMAENLQWHAV